ncbi:uncharacterized protein [Prorops nasuta]|uniref:uncharacterized protein n=1 Tax=Prorops nasuta TaxID=863751 RepID=UPI0034CEE569
MAEDLDDTFRMIVRDITKEIKRYSKRDQRAVAGWLQQVGKEVQTNEEKQARNDFGRYLRYFVQLGEKLPDDVRQPMCTKDFRKFGKSSATSKGQCPRKDVIAELTSIFFTAG